MPEWMRILIAGMACYRLAQLVTIDEGPWMIFQRLRETAGAYDRDQRGQPESLRGRLFACPYCMGLYLALPCAAACLWPTLIGDLLLLLFGLAGIQTYLQGPRRPL